MEILSKLDLGASILYIIVLIGFIGCFFVFIRFAIILINYIRDKTSEGNGSNVPQEKKERKGF